MRKWIACFLLVCLCFSSHLAFAAAPRLPEPASVPIALKGTEPHKPEVSLYYLASLLWQKKITFMEVVHSQRYMAFRYLRRQADLRRVAGMPQEERRAYMRQQRLLRGNPLKEYAQFCHLTLARARDLMDLMHESDKGTGYYNQLHE